MSKTQKHSNPVGSHYEVVGAKFRSLFNQMADRMPRSEAAAGDDASAGTKPAVAGGSGGDAETSQGATTTKRKRRWKPSRRPLTYDNKREDESASGSSSSDSLPHHRSHPNPQRPHPFTAVKPAKPRPSHKPDPVPPAPPPKPRQYRPRPRQQQSQPQQQQQQPQQQRSGRGWTRGREPYQKRQYRRTGQTMSKYPNDADSVRFAVDDNDDPISYDYGPTSYPDSVEVEDPQPQQNAAQQQQQQRYRGRPKTRFTDPYEFYMNNFYKTHSSHQRAKSQDAAVPRTTNFYGPDVEYKPDFEVKRRPAGTIREGNVQPASGYKQQQQQPRRRPRAYTMDPPATPLDMPSVHGAEYPEMQTRGRNPTPHPSGGRLRDLKDRASPFLSRSRSRRSNREDDDLIKRVMASNPPSGYDRDTPFPTESSKRKVSIPSIGDPKYGGSGDKDDENAAISPPPPSNRSRRYGTPSDFGGDARPDYEKPGVLSSGMNFLRSLGNQHRRHDRNSNRRMMSPFQDRYDMNASPRYDMDPIQPPRDYNSSALERPVGSSRSMADGYYGDGYSGYPHGRGGAYGQYGGSDVIYGVAGTLNSIIEMMVYGYYQLISLPPILKYPISIALFMIGMHLLNWILSVMETLSGSFKRILVPWGGR